MATPPVMQTRQIVEIPDTLARGIRHKPQQEFRHLTDNQLLRQLQDQGLLLSDIHVSRRSFDLLMAYALQGKNVQDLAYERHAPEYIRVFELLQEDFDKALEAIYETPELARNGAVLLELLTSQKEIRKGNPHEDSFLSAQQRDHPLQRMCDDVDNRDVGLVQRLVNKTYAKNHPMRKLPFVENGLIRPVAFMQMVRHCGRALEHVPLTERDKSLVRMAIYQDPWAVEFAPEEHVDRYQWFDVCERDGLVVQFFPFAQNEDKSWFEGLLITAVTSNRRALDFIPEKYHTAKVQAAARVGRDIPEGYDEAQNSISMPVADRDSNEDMLYAYAPLPDRSTFKTFDTDGNAIERPLTPTAIITDPGDMEVVKVKTADGLFVGEKKMSKF